MSYYTKVAGSYHTTDSVNVHVEPSNSSTTIKKLEKNTNIEVLYSKSEGSGWYCIGDGQWVYNTNLAKGSYIIPVTNTTINTSTGQDNIDYSLKQIMYTTESANVREGPGSSYNIQGKIYGIGTNLNTYGKSGGYYITDYFNKKGYVGGGVVSNVKPLVTYYYVQSETSIYNTNGTKIGTYYANEKIATYGIQDSNYIVYYNDDKALVSKGALGPNPPNANEFDISLKKTMYTKESINIHTEASKDSTTVSKVRGINTPVDTYGKSGSYYIINYDNKKHYISGSLLSSSKLTEEIMYSIESGAIIYNASNTRIATTDLAEQFTVYPQLNKTDYCAIYRDGDIAYILSNKLSKTKPAVSSSTPDNTGSSKLFDASLHKVMYTTESANVREEPNINGAFMSKVYGINTPVDTYGTKDGWYITNYASNTTQGFINSTILSSTKLKITNYYCIKKCNIYNSKKLVVGTYKAGDIVATYGTKDGMSIVYCNKDIAYVYTSNLGTTWQSHSITSTKTMYTTEACNMRSEPDINSESVYYINGTALAVTVYDGKTYGNNWYKSSYNGHTGYVSGAVLSTSKTNLVSTPDQKYTIMYTTEAVNVRDAASMSGKIIGRYENTNTAVKTIGTENGWYKISYNGVRGYIGPSVMSPKKLTSITMYTSGAVNVRNTPTINGTLMGKINEKNTMLQVYSSTKGWYEIRYNGNKAYVSSQYVSDKPTDTRNINNIIVKYDRLPGTFDMYTTIGSNIRCSASAEALIIGYINKDEVVKVVKFVNNWAVIYFNGYEGYTYKTNLTAIRPDNLPDKPKTTTKYTYCSVNVRCGPSIDYTKVGYYGSKGIPVEIYSQTAGWAKIYYNGVLSYNGEENIAYIDANLLTLKDPNYTQEEPVPQLPKGTYFLNCQQELVVNIDTGDYCAILNKGTKVTLNYISNKKKGDVNWANVTTEIDDTILTGYVLYTSLSAFLSDDDQDDIKKIVLRVMNNYEYTIQNEWTGKLGEVVIAMPTNKIGTAHIDLYAVQKTDNGTFQTSLVYSNISMPYGSQASVDINYKTIKNVIRDSEIRYYASCTDNTTKKQYYTISDINNWDEMIGSHYYMSPASLPTTPYISRIEDEGDNYLYHVKWCKELDGSDDRFDKDWLRLWVVTKNGSYDKHTIKTTDGNLSYNTSFISNSYEADEIVFDVPKNAVNYNEDQVVIYMARNYKYSIDEWIVGPVPKKIEEIYTPILEIAAIDNLKDKTGDYGEISIYYDLKGENQDVELTVFAYRARSLNVSTAEENTCVIYKKTISPGRIIQKINFSENRFQRGDYIKYAGYVEKDGKVLSFFSTSRHQDGQIWQDIDTHHYYNSLPNYTTPVKTYVTDKLLGLKWDKSYDADGDEVFYEMYVNNLADENKNTNMATFYYKSEDNPMKKAYKDCYYINRAYTSDDDCYAIDISDYDIDNLGVWIVSKDKYNSEHYLCGDTLISCANGRIDSLSVLTNPVIETDFAGHSNVSGDKVKLSVYYVHNKNYGAIATISLNSRNASSSNKNYKHKESVCTFRLESGKTTDYIFDMYKLLDDSFENEDLSFNIKAIADDGAVKEDNAELEVAFDNSSRLGYYNRQPKGSVLSLDESNTSLNKIAITWTAAQDDERYTMYSIKGANDFTIKELSKYSVDALNYKIYNSYYNKYNHTFFIDKDNIIENNKNFGVVGYNYETDNYKVNKHVDILFDVSHIDKSRVSNIIIEYDIQTNDDINKKYYNNLTIESPNQKQIYTGKTIIVKAGNNKKHVSVTYMNIENDLIKNSNNIISTVYCDVKQKQQTIILNSKITYN